VPSDGRARDRSAKNHMNDQFAHVAKALANGHRIELLDLLAQGERSVEVLAGRAGITLGLASSHLQVLRRAGLIASRREGTRVLYRLVGDDVYDLLAAVRTVAAARNADAERAARVFLSSADETVSREQLLERVRLRQAVVIDLRPEEEYLAGHVAGALSIPLDELEDRLAELPFDVEVVAYCRGPFCTLAPAAISLLRGSGRIARRLEDGFPEWRLAGLPVVVGTLPA